MSAPNTFGGEEDEPPTREESPPTTPGAVVDLAFMRGSNNFKASYTAELDNYPTRWVRPHAPRVGGPAPVCVPPTQALLRKRAMFQAGWNLLEEESWARGTDSGPGLTGMIAPYGVSFGGLSNGTNSIQVSFGGLPNGTNSIQV